MPNFRAAIILISSLLAPAGLTLLAQDASPSPAALAGNDILHQLDDACTAVYQKVAPAVVIIYADKKASADDQDQNFEDYFHSPESGSGDASPRMPERPTIRNEGSGFIVRPDGYIYTNCHVIEDADRIEVKLHDKRHFLAKVIGMDERTDIAVIKIDASALPTVTLVDSDSVRIGQMCFAIGIPYDLDYSFCRGIVSAKGRGNLTSTATKPMYEDYIQTDAFINPGNSGGPLIDIDGRVMGMTALVNGIGRGLAFAIPSNMLNAVGPQLIATGHAPHPWLGVTVANNDEAPSGEIVDEGICVETIEANAPAFKSDLRPQDTITKIDGTPILTFHALQNELLRKKIGETVVLTVIRSGKTIEIPVVTEEMPADLTEVAESHPFKAKVHPSDDTSYGLTVRDKGDGGVLVSDVVPDSPAGRAGIKPGDLLTAVDEQAVTDPGVCLQMLAAHRGAHGPILFITRGGHKGSAVLDADGADKQ